MQFKGSRIGLLCVKAEIFKMILSIRSIERTSRTKKDGVKTAPLEIS